MKTRLLIWVLWPSFLVSCLAEGLLFTFISPEDLSFFGHHVSVTDEAIYTIGFFVIWLFLALSSALTIYVLPGRLADLESGADDGLI